MNRINKAENETYNAKIAKISLSLATKEDVLSWSHGEVTKPETINYKSYKPERKGLFDELIFGPTTDFRCPICGRKYKRNAEGQTCSNTPLCEDEKPEILSKLARRSRMGHIVLEVPVVHFWFFKIDHSIISKLLGLRVMRLGSSSYDVVTKNDLENVIYYKSHIVLRSGGLKNLPVNTVINVNNAAEIYKNALIELHAKMQNNAEAIEIIEETMQDVFENTNSKVGNDYGVDFYELNEVIEAYSDAKIDTGSAAIEFLLKNVDLESEKEKVKSRIDEINSNELGSGKLLASRKQERNALYKRLKIINSFINSGQKPSSMLIYNLPVIPVELRPLVQLDGGRHSTSDINELYRRIIIRNNRLKKWKETEAPTLIVQNELRMIQEAVDALIDNSKKKPKPVVSKDGRNLKSIADALTGKKGRFRQNLLGKRVDYSGRSVIVSGPSLKMYQAGLPREMAAKLFEPWIIKRLIDKEIANSVKSARRLIENLNPIIWPEVAEVIKGRPVLLNRAPTLHRLSIQAFEPVLIRGRAIRLHPLVTTAFNADFDGDQMAVHVPISDVAVREAKELLFANRNILGPKDGEPIINPSQDMILGLYYLTIETKGAKGEGRIFNDLNEIVKAYERGVVSLHARVAIPLENLDKWKFLKNDINPGYVVSTVGKFILNDAFPHNFFFIFDNSSETYTNKDYMKKYVLPYGQDLKSFINTLEINEALIKKDIARIIRQVHNLYVPKVSKADIASVIDKVSESNYQEMQWEYNKLINYEGKPLSRIHADLLQRYTIEEFENIQKKLLLKNDNEKPLWEIEQYIELLEKVWFHYVNSIALFLDKIKDLGFKYSTISGISIAISDIHADFDKKAYIQQGDQYTQILKQKFLEGWITDDERYSLTIAKWAKLKDDIQKELSKKVKDHKFNPLFVMMSSGARATLSNYVQLGGLRGLMANNTKTLKADAENERVVRSTVEIPVKSSFMDGLTSYEFYSSTHGARKGLTDTALNTAKSGYLTRRLVDVAQGIVVREKDCGTDSGFVVADIIDNKTKSVIVTLAERIEGRFSMNDIYDAEGSIIVRKNELITDDKVKMILASGIKKVEIRSVLACHTEMGVCQYCYGKDLATSRIVAIGEAVGITASQSIGEPGTQLTMRTFHTGGVAGVDDITGGFSRLTELIDAYHKPWGRPAIISHVDGKVIDIKSKSEKNYSQETIVTIEYLDENQNHKRLHLNVPNNATLRVQKNAQVKRGQKIIDGPVILTELLQVAGARAVQSYLLKEIQRIYRMQGISISDKYVEIIISRMLSKIQVTIPGDSDLIAGSLVDRIVFQRLSGKLISEGKKPPYGEVVIRGAKQIPLLSQSFLAAASYQESAKIIVNAAISSRIDNLFGLKENIILGHKIPAGTNFNYENKSKYDIQDPYKYFSTKIINGNKVDIDPYFDDILKDSEISEY